MKTTFSQHLFIAAPLAALLVSAPGLASAQPATPMKKQRRAKGGISAKLLADIQTKTGKPVTADQKAQLDAAANTHRAAVRAADTQFRSEIARITGLSEADARALGRKPKNTPGTATAG